MQRPSIAGVIFLCVFGLPFAGFGLFFAVVTAMKQPPDPNAWVGIALGLLFACIGFGLIARTKARKSRSERVHNRLRSECFGASVVDFFLPARDNRLVSRLRTSRRTSTLL